ncbi:MAG: ribosome biogenesis GTPase Der [Nitriliruptoraceae bacterium]
MTPATHGGPVVAIDGPAGSGKSTVAGRVADALGVPHIDTGALYRAAALACVRAGVDLDDADRCSSVVAAALIDRQDGRTLLDGDDVEDEIRGDVVTAAVSRVSAHPGVRDGLLPAQRRAVAEAGGVVEGRDIGTVVLPDADLKVFLTASVEERARRRAAQLGRDDWEPLVATLRERDEADGSRAASPLLKANDAWELDTTGMDIDDVVASIVDKTTRALRSDTGDDAGDIDPFARRDALPVVAVVGRPNVGKSTFVNRVIGRRAAIVEEKPGVTRDRVEYEADWAGRQFIIVDTGGWEHGATGMAGRIVEQADRAIATADLVVFIVDAQVGPQEDDERYARQLRRSDIPVLLVVNKVDGSRSEPLVHDFHTLGLGEPIGVGARDGRGMGDLLDAVVTRLPAQQGRSGDVPLVPHVAIVGRPNVGKSSLFNRLLGEERSLVDAVPHTTRDAVNTLIELGGRPWVLVDTAGMRRHYRRGEDTELYSVDRTRDAIAGADVVLFVVDASEPLGEQDQRLAALLRDAGCGVVLVCNKWDLVDEERREDLDKELDRLLSFAAWAPRVRVSAASGRGVRRLSTQLTRVWENYGRRIPTRELNRLVEEAVHAHAPPRQGNRQLRIRYSTQAEVRPPQFIMFTNGELPGGYRRYLERIIRERYDFTGVPLHLHDRPPAPRRR